MSAQHTPGPWGVFADGGDCPGIEADSFSVVVYGKSDEDDCGVQGRSDGEKLANARLIAAAPELLAKLNEVLDFYDALPSEHADGEAELLDSVTALITKTTGEQQ